MSVEPTNPSEELQRLEERLRAVGSIGHLLAAAVSVKSLLQSMVPHISKLMRAARTTLFAYDSATAEIWSQVAEGESTKVIRLRLGTGLAGWAAQSRQTLNIADAYADPRFDPTVDLRTGFRTKSVAVSPIVDKSGHLLGVLQVLNHESGVFSSDDISLLETIASETAYALENARLTEKLVAQNNELTLARRHAEKRGAELDLLYELEQEIAASFELPTLLESVLSRACGWLRSTAGVLRLAQGLGPRLFVWDAKLGHQGLQTPPHGELTLFQQVIQSREPRLDNRAVGADADQLQVFLGASPHALLAIPLVSRDATIGVLAVTQQEPSTGYSIEDLQMLTLIAGQLARAIDLTRAREAQRDVDRLAVIGRTMASVAHDLRAPMTSVTFYAQLMVGENDRQERNKRYKTLMSQIDEMAAMVSDVLAFARGDSTLRLAPVDIAAWAAEIADTLRPLCEPRQIVLTVSQVSGAVCIDIGRTKRIVYNLAKNAIDELRAHGKLDIDFKVDRGQLVITVQDTGPGIPEELKSRIFSPFVTTHKAHGTGIGLSIVKRFVDDQGGTITVDSAAGRGTTFVVQLPTGAPTP